MLVIGIDPGTATTGYGLVEESQDGSLKSVDYGVVITPPKTPMPQRLSTLYDSLKEILKAHQPESAAVEKIFFQKNVRTAMSVGQARGVTLLALQRAHISIAEYAPTEIKQAVSGYGGADKRQIQEMVRTLLNLDDIPKPDDAADALAVAICHLHSARAQALYEAGAEN